jgi:hypothetical protein
VSRRKGKSAAKIASSSVPPPSTASRMRRAPSFGSVNSVSSMLCAGVAAAHVEQLHRELQLGAAEVVVQVLEQRVRLVPLGIDRHQLLDQRVVAVELLQGAVHRLLVGAQPLHRLEHRSAIPASLGAPRGGLLPARLRSAGLGVFRRFALDPRRLVGCLAAQAMDVVRPGVGRVEAAALALAIEHRAVAFAALAADAGQVRRLVDHRADALLGGALKKAGHTTTGGIRPRT